MKCPGVKSFLQAALLPDTGIILGTRLSDVHKEKVVVGVNQRKEDDAESSFVVKKQAAWKQNFKAALGREIKESYKSVNQENTGPKLDTYFLVMQKRFRLRQPFVSTVAMKKIKPKFKIQKFSLCQFGSKLTIAKLVTR